VSHMFRTVVTPLATNSSARRGFSSA
jgi:hypothetical protein